MNDVTAKLVGVEMRAIPARNFSFNGDHLSVLSLLSLQSNLSCEKGLLFQPRGDVLYTVSDQPSHKHASSHSFTLRQSKPNFFQQMARDPIKTLQRLFKYETVN
jgi:hypothetical protein